MFKKRIITLVLLLLVFLFVGCDAQVASPTNVRIDGNILLFEVDENVITVNAYAKSDNNNVFISNVVSGYDLSNANLSKGDYKIALEAVDEAGNKSDLTDEVSYSSLGIALYAPNGLEINNGKLSWNSVLLAESYDVIFTNADGEEVTFNSKTTSTLLTNKNLAAGEYAVCVKAITSIEGYLSSSRSEGLNYTVELRKLDTPTGLDIDEEGFISFSVSGSSDAFILRFTSSTGTVIDREITSGGAEISELIIPDGDYQVSICAKGDGIMTADSDFSSPIEYKKELKYMVLKEKDLINAGYVKWMGRTYYNETTLENEVYHSASGFEVFFKGSEVIATITATNYSNKNMRPCIVIVIDDDFTRLQTLFLSQKETTVILAQGITDGKEHKIDLYKRSESINSHIGIKEIKTDGIFEKKIVDKSLKIEVIAASSSTGYGNLGSASSGQQTTSNSDCLQAFAFLTARALNADINIFSASGWGCYASNWTNPKTVNVTDAYEYVDFNSSIKWIHEKYVPDVVVVNLGTNDYSYINAATSETEKDARMNAFQEKYVTFLRRLHELYPDAQLIVLYGLMNESNIYEATERIVNTAKIYIPDLASIKINGDAKGYNSHPSVSSHQQIARTLTEFIKVLLNI